MIEAMSGQIFLATLVARLVSTFRPTASTNGQDGSAGAQAETAAVDRAYRPDRSDRRSFIQRSGIILGPTTVAYRQYYPANRLFGKEVQLQSVTASPGADRTPLIEPLRRWDPERIGGYALIGRLGAGAMGQVYLGRSAAGRLVAVKTIRIELAEEPDFRTRFAQEVAAARRVSGAFTAAVVAADPEADVPWLATAYVPAPSLSTLVQACGPLPVPAVRWLAAGCAEALESIHGAGLVHRDLKPSNVLVSPDGPRVIDFGVARAAERIQLTMTRGAVGHSRLHGARAGQGHPAGDHRQRRVLARRDDPVRRHRARGPTRATP